MHRRIPETLSEKSPSLIILILLISFPPVCTVLISPGLPQISDHFHISNSQTQQLITLFLLGYAFGQLCYPSIANYYGRKAAIFTGMIVFIISCVLCILSIFLHHFALFSIGRFIMAIGSSVGMNITYTIINDYYPVQRARTIISYVLVSIAVLPAAAVAIGGLLVTRLGWEYCIYLLSIYGIFIMILCTGLPETLTKAKQKPMKFWTTIHGYLGALKNLNLIYFSLVYGFCCSIIYVVAAAAPFIAMDIIGIKAQVYGLYLILSYGTQLLSSFLSGYLSKHYKGFTIINLGLTISIFGCILMWALFYFNYIGIFSLILPLAIIMFGLPMIYSNATIYALSKHDDKANGSSIMSFIVIFGSFFATYLYGLVPSSAALVLPSFIFGILIIAIISYFMGYKEYHRFEESL